MVFQQGAGQAVLGSRLGTCFWAGVADEAGHAGAWGVTASNIGANVVRASRHQVLVAGFTGLSVAT